MTLLWDEEAGAASMEQLPASAAFVLVGETCESSAHRMSQCKSMTGTEVSIRNI